MKRKSALPLLLSAILVLPTFTAVAATYDEQYSPIPAPEKNYQGYLLQDSAEMTRFGSSLLNFTMSETGTVETVTACSSLSSAGCTFTKRQAYWAELGQCDAINKVDCIVSVSAKNETGTALAVEYLGIFPKEAPQDFVGDPSVNLPSGSEPLLVRIPGAPHQGGDLYMVKSEIIGSRDFGKTEKFIASRFQTGIFAVSLMDGNYQYSRQLTDAKQYPTAEWVIGGGTDTPSGCVLSSRTQCAMRYSLPQDIAFGFQVRLSTPIVGWLHGRLNSPEFSIETEASGTKLLTISAKPIKVPLIDVWLSNEKFSPELKAFYADQPNNGSTTFGSKDQPLSEIALRRDGNSVNDLRSMKEFLAWLPVIGDKAQAMPTAWTLKTMKEDGSKSSECFAKAKGIAGVVSTNAAQYLDGPPSFNKSDGFLDYKVAAPHLTSTGEVFKGSYDLVMSSDVARCLYGFSNAPIGATVSIISADGEPSVATTLVREKNNWIFLQANNFTFSTPTVRIQFTQEAPAKPVIVPIAKTKKISITCVKGKTSKKITAIKPKCPTGYKKK
jgi:hypothetical protein